jgi:pyrroline-5-carboxylate reductase
MAARLVVMGGGNMGEALVSGLIQSRWATARQLAVVEQLPSRRAELADAHAGLPALEAIPAGARDAVIAVKPADVEEACAALSNAGVRRVLSIAAGVPMARLERWLGDGVRVIRAMPNTPALVGAGAAAIAPGTAADDADLDWAEGILGAVGTVVRVPEKLLDAVTGLSGSGPAYVFLVAEALVEAGVLVGLPRDVATALTVQTILGSAQLLARSPEGATSLRFAVTSPGGTTAAGLQALETASVRAAFLEAVAAATARSRELGAS